MADNKHLDVTNLVDADIFKSQVKLPICVVYSDAFRVHSRLAETEFDFVRWVLQGLTHSSERKVRLIPVEYADASGQDVEDS